MELKPEDLFNKCDECGGEGKVKRPEESSGGSEKCEACNGCGFTVTRTGEAIALLVKQFENPKVLNGIYSVKVKDRPRFSGIQRPDY